jgi:hypothetical protein
VETVFEAYNIAGSNYFKLRDLAYALSETEKPFDVGYDSATKSIVLTTGENYRVVGGEMAGKGADDKSATPTNPKITLDGKEINLIAYNISGNNYFKLRDIGAVLNFGVAWNATSRTVEIDTYASYTPE